MNKLVIGTLLASLAALPALAQVTPPPAPQAPAGYAAPPVVNATVAAHDRLMARRAARHGRWRAAAIDNHAANVAHAEAVNPQ